MEWLLPIALLEFIGMEAGSWLRRTACAVVVGLLFISGALPTSAGSHRTQNFIVQAPDSQLAVAVGNAAEKYRRELASYWTGSELPPWPRPCPIRVISGPNLAAQGVTTYNPRPVSDFQMEVVGTPQRILDSVLPHEVTHTVLATYFGRPLPRWADEGICTTVEHPSEKRKHEAKLREFLGSRRGIAMNQLFLLTEYPQDVLPMYAQGYSVCRFLIEQQGPRTFIKFLKDYMHRPSWTSNVRKHYGYESLLELQNNWLAWVKNGGGDVTKFAKLNPRNQATIQLAGGQTQPAKATLAVAQADTLPTPSTAEQSPATATLAMNAAKGTSGWQPNDGAGPPISSPPTPAPAKSAPASGQLAAATPGMATDAIGSDGWYLRRRQRAQQGQQDSPGLEIASTAAATEPIMPPSVRDSGTYSAAQPQPEQQWSRNSIPMSRVHDATSGRWR